MLRPFRIFILPVHFDRKRGAMQCPHEKTVPKKKKPPAAAGGFHAILVCP